MRKFNLIKRALLSLGILTVFTIFLMSCAENPSSSNSREIIVNGKVVGNSPSSGVENATISTAKIKSDGSLEMIDEYQAVTNASGEFLAQVQSENQQPVIIIARKGSDEWQSVIDNSAQTNDTGVQSIVGLESSAEAAVYRRIIRMGYQHEVNYSLVQDYIGPEKARTIRDNHNAIQRIAQTIIEHASGLTRTQITAFVYDSTSYVKIKNNFLTHASDDSALVDSIIAGFQMDAATVDSLLQIRQDDDGHSGEWDDEGEDDNHEHGDYNDDHDEYSQNRLKIVVRQNRRINPEDSSLVSVKVKYDFSTDSTSRANLVAAIVSKTQLTRSQVQASLTRRDDDSGDHEDDEDHEEGGNVEVKIDSDIALGQEAHSLIDSLTNTFEGDMMLAHDSELRLTVEKQNGEVSVSQNLGMELSDDQMNLWNAILNTVRGRVVNASESDISVNIRWKFES